MSRELADVTNAICYDDDDDADDEDWVYDRAGSDSDSYDDGPRVVPSAGMHARQMGPRLWLIHHAPKMLAERRCPFRTADARAAWGCCASLANFELWA